MSRRKRKAPPLIHLGDPPKCGKSPGRRVRTTDDAEAANCPKCRDYMARRGP